MTNRPPFGPDKVVAMTFDFKPLTRTYDAIFHIAVVGEKTIDQKEKAMRRKEDVFSGQ
jgi:hypothetical protein